MRAWLARMILLGRNSSPANSRARTTEPTTLAQLRALLGHDRALFARALAVLSDDLSRPALAILAEITRDDQIELGRLRTRVAELEGCLAAEKTRFEAYRDSGLARPLDLGAGNGLGGAWLTEDKTDRHNEERQAAEETASDVADG